MLPILSVVIASQGRPERLKRVLDGLAVQTDRRFELILVWDGCDTGEIPDVGLNQCSVRTGGGSAAKARNEGLRVAVAARTLIIDDDCVPHPETVARHVAEPSDTCTIGTRWHVSAAVVENLPNRPVSWGELASYVHKKDNRDANIRSQPRFGSKDRSNLAYTCHLSFPTAFATRTGGFWEDMVASGFEDSEFGLRLFRNGVRFSIPEDLPPVIHLDHPKCGQQCANSAKNRELYFQTKRNPAIVTRNGGLSHFRRRT
jgi:glycosyltransferase involved in cell wall biosynthesis